MADNIDIKDASNVTRTVATDEIGAVSYQKVKIAYGPNDTATDVTTGAGLPVQAAELTSLAGTVSTHAAAVGSTPTGQIVLAVRRDADSAPTADGQITYLIVNEAGRLKVAGAPAQYAPVTGSITASAQTVAADVSAVSNVMCYVTGTFAGHNCTFEGSIDGGANWFTVQAVRSNANAIETTTGALSAAPAYAWKLSVNALTNVRVRATAHTGGTANWRFTLGSYATEPIPAAQVTATQPVSGTVTATVTSTRITPNAADGHSTTHHLISAAGTNATSVKTSAGAIGLITVTNSNAAGRYFKLYNKASAPTVGTDTPVMTVFLPPNSTTVIGGNSPIRLGTGIAYCLTTGITVADTGAVAASEHAVAIFYT